MLEVWEPERAASGPSSIVRHVPVLGPSGSVPLPFLFIEGASGAVGWHREALAYAKACLAAYELSTISHDVETIGRFYDFYRVFWGAKPLPAEAIDYLVYAYLVWRHNGTVSDGRSCLGGLLWAPVASNALRAEFNSLARYFHFSSRTWGHVSLGQFREPLDPDAVSIRRLRSTAGLKEREFFVHLAASREYWARQYGSGVEMPPVSVLVRSGGSIRHVMPEEEIWAIIQAESNPVFRALWIVGAFGGIRVSEQLNAWQVDVLPGSYRRLAFGYEGGDAPLFLRADPTGSRYIGDLGKPGPTRRHFLRDQYGMSSRKEFGRKHPLYAGWKGTLYLNGTLLLSEVFWLDDQAATLFAECAEEIREFHRIHQTSKRHPFFYVNVADPTREFRGDILKTSNVEAAWDRACLRCGLEPHRWGRNIHGLRHFYKRLANASGISRDHVQVMMGHKSIGSQDDYGRAAQEVAASLSKVRQQRQLQVRVQK